MTLDIALACAARGWVVHPVGEDKRPLTRWSETATKDADAVRRLWRRFPQALVGVVTGAKSNLYVVDVDRSGALEEFGLNVGDGIGALTRREGGIHYYFASPSDGRPVRNSAGDGLDIRGDGGFVVSWHMPPEQTLWPLPVPVAEWARNRSPNRAPGQTAGQLPETITEGARESSLVSLAGSMRRRGSTAEEILAALEATNRRCVPPLEDADLERIAGSVSRYPSEQQQYADILAALQSRDTASIELPTEGEGGDFTQYGAAAALARGMDWFRWRDDERAWWAADGGFWQRQRTMEVNRTVTTYVVSHYAKASAGWTNGVEKYLRELKAVEPSEFDRHPWLLGVQGGVVDLRTGDLQAAESDLLLTRVAPTQYKETATCPKWLDHLARLFEDDSERVDWFQRAVGAALVGNGSLKDHFFVVVLGAPGNGKGTAMRTLVHVLGQDQHVVNLQASDLTGRERHLQWMIRLQGARLAIVEEMRRSALDVNKLKALSGGDTITANKMRQADETWEPTHSLFITSNHQPNFGGDTVGMARRYRPIPTGPSLPREEQSVTHEERLKSEAMGILAWAVKGSLLWQQDGHLKSLAIIDDLAHSHIVDDDPYQEWADECLLFDSTWWTSRKAVVGSVNWWRAGRGLDTLTAAETKELYAWLRSHGAGDVRRSESGAQQHGFTVRIVANTQGGVL
jgi:putative DNA primase/helicase